MKWLGDMDWPLVLAGACEEKLRQMGRMTPAEALAVAADEDREWCRAIGSGDGSGDGYGDGDCYCDGSGDGDCYCDGSGSGSGDGSGSGSGAGSGYGDGFGSGSGIRIVHGGEEWDQTKARAYLAELVS